MGSYLQSKFLLDKTIQHKFLSYKKVPGATKDFSKNKMVHAMLHVRDLDASMEFYENLGLGTLSLVLTVGTCRSCWRVLRGNMP